MSFFGLTDPYIVGAYVGSLLCVAFCVIYGYIKSKALEEEEEEDDQ